MDHFLVKRNNIMNLLQDMAQRASLNNIPRYSEWHLKRKWYHGMDRESGLNCCKTMFEIAQNVHHSHNITQMQSKVRFTTI